MDVITKHFNILQGFLCINNTFEIGCLQQIMRTIGSDPSMENYASLSNNIKMCLGSMIQELKQNPSNKGKKLEYLTMIILDSLIFDLYAKHCKEKQKNRMNQSLYASQSQVSIYSMKTDKSISGVGQSQVSLNLNHFKTLLMNLIQDPLFFKLLQQLIEQARPTSEIKTQLTLLIETFDYIIAKENMDEKVYISNKKILNNYMTQKESYNNHISIVNKVIFSNKLDKINKLLAFTGQSNSPEFQKEIHFALGRIYFAAYQEFRTNFKRTAFKKEVQYPGRDMIYNLIKQYVNQDPSKKKNHLFSDQEEKNGTPLFLFIKHYFELLFMPLVNQFSDIFDKQIMFYYSEDDQEFFTKTQGIIKTRLVPFIENLPSEFTNLFSQIYELILERQSQDTINPISPLKQLFFGRFFLNTNLKQIISPNITQQPEYFDAANKINSLLYKVKSYQEIEAYQQSSQLIQKSFEDMIKFYDQQTSNTDVYNYYITDPILRHDYVFLSEIITLIQFSSTEEKSYNITRYKTKLPDRNREKLLSNNEQMVQQLLGPENFNKFQQNQQDQKEINMVNNRQIETPKFQQESNYKPKSRNEILQEAEQNKIIEKNEEMQKNISEKFQVQNPSQIHQMSPQKELEITQAIVQSQKAQQETEQREKQKQKEVLKLQEKLKEQDLQMQQQKLQFDKINFQYQQLLNQQQQQLSNQQQNPLQQYKFEELQHQMNQQLLEFQQTIRKQQEEFEENRQQNLKDKENYKKVLDQLFQEKKERLLMEDDKIQLVNQINQLEERNSFLRNTVKARYPISIGAQIEDQENIDLWKQEQIEKQVQEDKKNKENKENDEFFKLQKQLKLKQMDIHKDSVKHQVHQKTVLK